MHHHLIAVSLIVSLLGCDFTATAPVATQTDVLFGTVDRFMDGDTFQLKANDGQVVKIRLSGIDAPEKKQRFGPEASAALHAMTDGQQLRVVVTDTDRYKRLIGDVYVGDVWINGALVGSGLAHHYVEYSDDVRLAQLQHDAQRGRLGVWSDARRVAPWDFRNGVRISTALPVNADSIRETDTVVFVTKSGTKYHRDTCRYSANATPMPLSRADAYEPCAVCKPLINE